MSCYTISYPTYTLNKCKNIFRQKYLICMLVREKTPTGPEHFGLTSGMEHIYSKRIKQVCKIGKPNMTVLCVFLRSLIRPIQVIYVIEVQYLGRKQWVYEAAFPVSEPHQHLDLRTIIWARISQDKSQKFILNTVILIVIIILLQPNVS